MTMGTLLVGTSSWSQHGGFYPPGTKPAGQLPYYASLFPVVEVNSSRYGVPPESTVATWVRVTPNAFIFDVKPPAELTWTPTIPGTRPPRGRRR